MPWPPVVPPATRANATPSIDLHAADHNAISQALTDLVAQLNAVPWNTATLVNSWVAFSAGNPPLQYRKIGDTVQLRGLIKGGASGPTITTLPAGYRPPQQILLPSISSDGAACRLTIETTGIITATFSGLVYLPFSHQFSVTA
jgi:hypothetical protein